jgi:hypothetical protein
MGVNMRLDGKYGRLKLEDGRYLKASCSDSRGR